MKIEVKLLRGKMTDQGAEPNDVQGKKDEMCDTKEQKPDTHSEGTMIQNFQSHGAQSASGATRAG